MDAPAVPPRSPQPPLGAGPPSRKTDFEGKIAVALLALLALACAVVLRPFLSALLWAAILCSSTWPIYARLERLLDGRRALAAAIMALSAALLLLLPVVVLASRLAGEFGQVAALVSGWLATGPQSPPGWVRALPLIGGQIDTYWQEVAGNGAKLASDLRGFIPQLRDFVVALGLKLGSGVTDLLLALLISFFFYRDGMAGAQALRSALARVGGRSGERMLALAHATVRGVVYGILGTNLIEALLAALGLHLASVPGALVLSFALFFLTLVPLAPAVIFVPAILWLFEQGEIASASFLVVWYVLVFVILEGALRSFLISRGGELPLIMVFLGMLGGIAAFGLLGVFLGPTLLALASALLREWNAAETGLVRASGRSETAGGALDAG